MKNSVVMNLKSDPTHPMVLAAYVTQLEDMGSWYFNLTTDGISNGIGSLLSRQYKTYDEAVYGMNERIADMYS
jgi:hypothetical protein